LVANINGHVCLGAAFLRIELGEGMQSQRISEEKVHVATGVLDANDVFGRVHGSAPRHG
jgi:hypothetical protein